MFEPKPSLDAVHCEFRARQLAPRLQALREFLFILKEETCDVAKQQWARSRFTQASSMFSLVDSHIVAIESELAGLLFAIRELKTLGREDDNPGITHMDV